MSASFQRNLEREREFMEELGRAMTAWRCVEQSLYLLYAALMRGANRHLVSVSFHHHLSFEARVLLVGRCMFFVLSKKQKEQWKRLRKRLKTLNDIRNELVHSAFIIEGGTDGSQIPVIAPSFFDATAIPRERAMNPTFRHDTEKIQKHRRNFIQLANDLRVFREISTFRISRKTWRTASAAARTAKRSG